MTITLTEVAELRLRTFLRSSNGGSSTQRGVRFSVNDGGCSGYQYALNIADAPQTDDLVVEQGSLKVYVDRQSAPLLEGVVVDYVDGLIESGFKFTNPNATDTCGCGQSFQAGDCTPAGVSCS
ncbi:MAG: iron-sulfur cluster assembly accessory protein [Cyanothece sp. SIO1E1]|nr:iron-sulfur cluster assembly accessory protein [Cyanothece sp. SIO1E1]